MTTSDAASLAVAVVQFAPSADSRANLDQIAHGVQTAAERGARVVLLPEYSNVFIDPFDESLAARAEPLDGPFITALTALAERWAVVIVCGVLESTGSGVRNTAVAVDASGIRASYRKLHLYDAFGHRESDWITAGEIAPPETFEIAGFRFGLMTCYDLRFPEVARTLADVDVDVMLVPAAWMRGPLKEFHWRTLLTSRAIENTAYVVAADHPPPLGVGNSAVVDPQGVAIAGIGTGTEVVVAHLDRALLDRVRMVNPALRLRRFQVIPR
ncbi:carbon-nitrogen hydrolase family protein [Microbacterium sediminicola]|uniref:Carbon-nitrogen hydrolase family protein n=1 Tax=Microbacterium sediminicola TaxID=415210 RepID=A0ABN2HN91_9MICO